MADMVLSADELHVLTEYRKIKKERTGHLFIQFERGRVTKYEVKTGGQVEYINSVLPDA